MIRFFSMMLLTLLLASACKKDKKTTETPAQQPTPTPVVAKKIDTIKPHDYLPAFPGSWWNYIVDSTGSSITLTTSATYIKHGYSYRNSSYETHTDTFYVPIYDGAPLYGYNRFGNHVSYSDSAPMTPYLYENVRGWVWQSVNSHEDITAKTVSINQTVVVQGKNYSPVIIVEYWDDNDMHPEFNAPIKRLFYAKDIGLIKEELFNRKYISYSPVVFTVDTVVTKQITSYHIER